MAWRLYALLILYALIVDFVIHYYGEIRESRLMTKCPALRPALALFVLPRISVWYVLLKSVSHRKSKDIRVDVITRRDVLYRGTVEDVLLAPDGALSGLLLTKPHRYQREKYLDDLKKYSQGPKTEAKPKPDNYWKEIPGHAFLVMSDSIETINLRSYERGDREMAELAQELNKILNLRLTAARGRKSSPRPS